jgi:hypothetical protein
MKSIVKHLYNLLLLLAVSALILTGCQPGGKKGGEAEDSVMTDTENETSEAAADEDEWTTLFDGSSTDMWRSYAGESFPEEGWSIEDGTLYLAGSGKGEAGGRGGDIITVDTYDDFMLEMEWKISEGGNSGIFYMAKEIEGEPIWKSAPEMQILDNEKHPDAMLGKDGNRMAGSLYDLIPADPQNANPAGEWNKVRIMKYQGTVVHFMNGEQVVEYHLWTDDWNEMVENSKFSEFEHFAKYSEGHIGLQDHGNDVWFRNIRIKEM